MLLDDAPASTRCSCGTRLRATNRTGHCTPCNVVKPCSFDGCDRRRDRADQHCVGHRAQRARGGPMAPLGSWFRTPQACRFGHPMSPEQARCFTCRQHHRRARRYGLSLTEYEALLAEQAGQCAICSTDLESSGLHVDHDHTSGKVRGILCPPCNKGIGHLRDSPDVALAAAVYLLTRKD